MNKLDGKIDHPILAILFRVGVGNAVVAAVLAVALCFYLVK